jgi:hypothetical protein
MRFEIAFHNNIENNVFHLINVNKKLIFMHVKKK